MFTPIRWQQRFQNYEKAFAVFEKLVHIQNLNETERLAIIQSFEICFELSWKLLKDYLEAGGKIVYMPRNVLKEAMQNEMISDGRAWLEALDHRNMTSHTYNEELAQEIVDKIQKEYYQLFKDLFQYFKSMYHG